MSSIHHVKKVLGQLLNFSGQELGHKIIIPDAQTVILYDMYAWDESMSSWVRHKLPTCKIQIMSMNESISGFAVVFNIQPPNNTFISHLLKLGMVLILVSVMVYLFMCVNTLTVAQQHSMYNKSQGDSLPPPTPPVTEEPSSYRSSTSPMRDKPPERHSQPDYLLKRQDAFKTAKAGPGGQPTQETEVSTPVVAYASGVFNSLVWDVFSAQAVPPAAHADSLEQSPSSLFKAPPGGGSVERPSKTGPAADVNVDEPYWVSSKRKARDF
jgi:hypothetical protein